MKRLRLSVMEATVALDEVTLMVDPPEAVPEPVGSTGEGSVEVAGTGRDDAQPSGSDAMSAFRRFEAAVVAARERLTELTDLQEQMDEKMRAKYPRDPRPPTPTLM